MKPIDNEEFLAVCIGAGALVLLVSGGGLLAITGTAQQHLIAGGIVVPTGTGIIDLPYLGALDLPRLVIAIAIAVIIIGLGVLARTAQQAKKKKAKEAAAG